MKRFTLAALCLSFIGHSALAANIGFFPDPEDKGAALALADFFEENGHTIAVVDDSANIADDVDLIIHSNTPPTPFSAFATVAKPVIAWDADFHDNSLIARLGQPVTFEDGFDLTVVEENADHPVLDGMTGDIPWTNTSWTLQGMGGPPAEGKVLLTYLDPLDEDIVRPALIVLEKDAATLGFFGPQPIEGAGYWVGSDLNEPFGGGGPRAIQLDPVDVSGHASVQLTMALAATDADFESVDSLSVLVDRGSGFQQLALYTGVGDEFNPCFKGLADEGGQCLSPVEFRDFTWEIPDGNNELTVRIEAFNSAPNEVVGIDNIRITGNNDALIHQQGFNDPEPVGYTPEGQGSEIAAVGPALWDVNLNVDQIGLPAFAPARRASILWADHTTDPQTGDEDVEWWEEESLEIWLNLVDWALAASNPADFDGDGTVNFADFVMFSNVFGQSVPPADVAFDLNMNGEVDFADFVQFSNAFGQPAEISSVPEPHGFVMAALGLLVILRCRRPLR